MRRLKPQLLSLPTPTTLAINSIVITQATLPRLIDHNSITHTHDSRRCLLPRLFAFSKTFPSNMKTEKRT
ncbi:hypothetical protein Cob_v002169 [Colletotrichum orbiculare MAFF 240422]|uniref:Uncharacterized protein n=1 Tax=Colletotrichum orbiculare (strain 104-T / ATCC 96160 / CBS 514.97 / LARS 414 / MAFF 240422) TaxID=1213857 RepID=A0A484G2R5_COLOR|nr:hypothetical protein Cob_v002169 [Colletotrichum orbiculare MAFF 240422]